MTNNAYRLERSVIGKSQVQTPKVFYFSISHYVSSLNKTLELSLDKRIG